MAGPPYYDTIPPSVIRGEESATPMSPPTTPPPPPAITPKIRRPVSTPRPRWPYRPPSSVPAFVTTALDDRDPWVTSHSSQESTLSNSPGDFDWFNNWNINWNHDWNGGDWSNKWNSDISSRKDTTSPTSLIVTNSRNSLDVYDDEDEARFDLPQAEGTENSLLADLLLNHKFPRGPATRHRYPERSQTEDEYPETTRTKTRYPETSKANRKYSENPPRMNKYPETGFTENRYPERPPETSTYPERPQRENKFPERPPVNERYPEKPLITDIYSARASAEEQYPETPRQDRYPMRTRHPEVPLKEDTHPATTTTRYLETHLTESGHSGHLKIPAVQVRHLQGPRTKTRHPERLPTKTRHPERLPTKTRHPERLPTKTRYPERLPTKTRHPPLTANERYGPVSLERPLASPRPSRKQQRVPVVTVEQRRGAVATGGERGVPETSVGIHGGSWYTEERKRQPSVAYQSSRTPGESRDTTWDESRPLHRPPPSLRQAAPPRPVLTWQTAREAGGQPRRGG
ncbi:uncharacterized protein LOC121879101 [Homarus americanus]|uniref:uncharacterized protein LOC121879101 n=1 Tax=Homarus americanus TaxID=6706 RepID=UPI001C485828|nr:uncharacterized protein LOC121879101 [Homarus americanus]